MSKTNRISTPQKGFVVNELADEAAKLLENEKGPRGLTWDEERKNLVLEIVMFGAFYPIYFLRQFSLTWEPRSPRFCLGRTPGPRSL